MERGLLWLPLLGLFVWLAWAGWNEYQKLEAYRIWARSFERAKYDIYAVLGQNGDELTWGKPTRQGAVNLQTFSLATIASVQLVVDGTPVDPAALPDTGKTIYLEFGEFNSETVIRIPFTEIPLAAQWAKHLQQDLQRLRLEPLEPSSSS